MKTGNGTEELEKFKQEATETLEDSRFPVHKYFQGSDSTDEELVTQVKQLLHVQDETFLFSNTDTGSTGSSSNKKSNKKKSKLNGSLEECNIESIGRPWIVWDKASEKTQQLYKLGRLDATSYL